MKANIVRIGNSQGIRLPKVLLQECGLNENTPVEIIVKNHQLIIKLYEKPRAGWQKAFQAMAAKKEDALIDVENMKNEWDKKEWKW